MAYVIKYCEDNSIEISQTKIQKLLYCCYGIVLAEKNERLTDEYPQAWMYGPVFPRTYRDVKDRKLTPEMADEFARICPTDILVLMNQTLNVFGVDNAQKLSTWSHEKGSPWSKARPLTTLNDSDVAEYFTAYVQKVKNGNQYESII